MFNKNNRYVTRGVNEEVDICLLYTSDAADEEFAV